MKNHFAYVVHPVTVVNSYFYHQGRGYSMKQYRRIIIKTIYISVYTLDLLIPLEIDRGFGHQATSSMSCCGFPSPLYRLPPGGTTSISRCHGKPYGVGAFTERRRRRLWAQGARRRAHLLYFSRHRRGQVHCRSNPHPRGRQPRELQSPYPW